MIMPQTFQHEFDKLQVTPVAGALGAEVSGVDLAALDDGIFAEIYQAMLDYQVIFFRDQKLMPEQFRTFGARFGTLKKFPPELFTKIRGEADYVSGFDDVMMFHKTKEAKLNVGGRWHSDLEHTNAPPQYTILYGRLMPPSGGDTMFSNQYASYEALSDGMKEMLGKMRAEHTDVVFDEEILLQRLRDPNARPDYDASKRKNTTNYHPVVRTHQETGRKSLYVSPMYTTHFQDMTREESRGLLEHLYEHMARPEFTCRFRWAEDSIAVWDNRCTQHYALNDYQGQERTMHRMTIEGDRPQ
jgi:taurine dioxygenase